MRATWAQDSAPMTAGDSTIRVTISELAREDAAVAADAEAALEWLTAGAGAEVLTQEDLQTFLWYGLPMKWLTDGEHHRRIVDALARAFDLLDLTRYAAICRSETTASVLNAYENSAAAGKKAFRAADIASGIHPPDVDDFEWGPIMGIEESRALSSSAEFLELAVASGTLVPGERGWRARQVELTRAHLTTPRIELAGNTYLDVVRSERFASWLRGRSSPTRLTILEPIVDLLRAHAQLPGDIDDPVPPLHWFLEQLVDGQTLTQTGYLNRPFVQEAATRFGWWDAELHGLPRSEADLFDLSQTRALAQQAGLIRRSGKKLVLTARGRTALRDPTVLWKTTAQALVPSHPFDRATGETALAVLVAAESVSKEELRALVAAVVGEEGWRVQHSGEPADDRSIGWSTYQTLNLCRALNLLAVGGHWNDRRYGLSTIGHATAIEALRHSATGAHANPLS
jgi:hypothetical protein